MSAPSIENGCPGQFFKVDKNNQASCDSFCPTDWYQETSDGVIYCIDDRDPQPVTTGQSYNQPGLPSASIETQRSSVSLPMAIVGAVLAFAIYTALK